MWYRSTTPLGDSGGNHDTTIDRGDFTTALIALGDPGTRKLQQGNRAKGLVGHN